MNSRHSLLNTRHSLLNTRHSLLNTRHSLLNTRHCLLNCCHIQRLNWHGTIVLRRSGNLVNILFRFNDRTSQSRILILNVPDCLLRLLRGHRTDHFNNRVKQIQFLILFQLRAYYITGKYIDLCVILFALILRSQTPICLTILKQIRSFRNQFMKLIPEAITTIASNSHLILFCVFRK